jgi:hypothetical protein
MIHEYYFQIEVNTEQIGYAEQLVEYSLKHHPVPNIWDTSPERIAKTKELRFTGSLGEAVFADVYGMGRKSKAFGALDGQDHGQDFVVYWEQIPLTLDLKAMQRKSGVFYGNYVLNIPATQLHKTDSKTDIYFCLSLHPKDSLWIASFLGYVKRADVLDGNIGILYTAGTERIRSNNTKFTFYEDTYEIDFKDFKSPPYTSEIQKMQGFQLLKLKTP